MVDWPVPTRQWRRSNRQKERQRLHVPYALKVKASSCGPPRRAFLARSIACVAGPGRGGQLRTPSFPLAECLRRRQRPIFFCAGDFRSSRLDIQHTSCQIARVHEMSGKCVKEKGSEDVSNRATDKNNQPNTKKQQTTEADASGVFHATASKTCKRRENPKQISEQHSVFIVEAALACKDECPSEKG